MRERGLRVTAQRRAILDYLAATERHPSAEQIGEAVNGTAAVVSRAALYNVLHTLCTAGLVREVVAGGVMRYDAKLSPHHHFHCQACGRIEDIPWEKPGVPSVTRLPGGRTVERCELTYRGRCADCVRTAP
jgi:Fe2+ or Zn2+ uptake regulation protein